MFPEVGENLFSFVFSTNKQVDKPSVNIGDDKHLEALVWMLRKIKNIMKLRLPSVWPHFM